MQELYDLEEKVNTLLKKYATLQATNKHLQHTITRQADQLQAMSAQLDITKQQLMAVEIANALPDETSKEEARKQIDAVIEDIDKILMKLND